ncbi:uncharacterized protein NDAI_0G01860 [Naumovozyma dairenensis CBS 421]|uniref:Galactokinase n=1 Tax=Naumovozyma dairenensis (strain ATCC 10597 / BCRC 20456 / CBS 421 / NBRC 0211 / NRRL Y-12639) TaxID=1071378 RepID=J7S4D3_NAUDC|nr:hypothetical protein NDAI_0G01860 [Naumovozyma dairenensis CBS 421]CCK73391.1 hypothetical protein NDAI_0G01860 [Naumovozyma dairenensis CBS 421]
MSIPVFHTNDRDLPDLALKKCPQVIENFKQTYGIEPDFVSRSPGRVNLIGEHIDYTDFSVLPLAIENDMLCAVKILERKENPSITLTNSDSRFAQRKFDLPLDGSYVTIDPSISDWSNYFKCGLHVAQQFLKGLHPQLYLNNPLIGLQVFCQSDIPVGSGLSSSSAFICAVALAVIRANLGTTYAVSKKDLTRITCIAEHYLGVSNGGMDQATSVYGQEDHALFVEFKPNLKATPFKFPKLQNHEIQFLIANTLIVANKFDTAPTNYNLRVIEVTTAANVLANKYGVALPHIPDSTMERGNLRDFMDAYYARYPVSHDNESKDVIMIEIERLTKMLELVEESLGEKKEGFTVDDVAEALDCSREEYTRDYLLVFPVRFQVLKLYKRAKHVFSEAQRVLKALKLMTSASPIENDEEFFQQFGQLMNESQESCDKLYECSCPEIDTICSTALQNGSYGSRLTGAGWGGCTVHLVSSGPNGNVEKVKKALIDQYYKVVCPNISDKELEEVILVSKPALGSCLYEL